TNRQMRLRWTRSQSRDKRQADARAPLAICASTARGQPPGRASYSRSREEVQSWRLPWWPEAVRWEKKYSVVPSHESAGPPSPNPLFSPSTNSGTDQSSVDVSARVDTHRFSIGRPE